MNTKKLLKGPPNDPNIGEAVPAPPENQQIKCQKERPVSNSSSNPSLKSVENSDTDPTLSSSSISLSEDNNSTPDKADSSDEWADARSEISKSSRQQEKDLSEKKVGLIVQFAR